MPTVKVRRLTCEELVAGLNAIHKDVQAKLHDAWDWQNAEFYTSALAAHLDSVAWRPITPEVHPPIGEHVVLFWEASGHEEDAYIHPSDTGDRWVYSLFDGTTLNDSPTHFRPFNAPQPCQPTLAQNNRKGDK